MTESPSTYVLIQGCSEPQCRGLDKHISEVDLISSLWDKTRSFRDIKNSLSRTREWAKWASERTSERSRGRERSEQSIASKQVSGASEWANGQASGPVLTSLFLLVPDHSAAVLLFLLLLRDFLVFFSPLLLRPRLLPLLLFFHPLLVFLFFRFLPATVWKFKWTLNVAPSPLTQAKPYSWEFPAAVLFFK